MEYRYEFGGQQVVVKVEADGDGYSVTVGDRTCRVQANLARPCELELVIDRDRRSLAYVAADGATRWVALGPSSARASSAAASQSYALTVLDHSRRSRRGLAGGQTALETQMPGIVRQVLVAEGQAVARGQALVLLEAMKMEIRVTAPEAGLVRHVAVTAGQTVERGQALIELGPAPDPPG